MKNIVRIIIISSILIIVLFNVAGCSSSVSPEEYDRVKSELADVNQQVDALQEKLDEAMMSELEYDQLDLQYQDLLTQYDTKIDEIQSLQSDFDELNAGYEQLRLQEEARTDEIQALQAEYDELNQELEELKQQAVFSEAEIDRAIFDLINQERHNNGLDELEWGVNLYRWARENSVAMSTTGEFKYTSWLSTQAVLITSGHETFDGLVNGVMAVWKQQKHEFKPKFLSTVTKYGAVATYKLGDIYYITFLANIDP